MWLSVALENFLNIWHFYGFPLPRTPHNILKERTVKGKRYSERLKAKRKSYRERLKAKGKSYKDLKYFFPFFENSFSKFIKLNSSVITMRLGLIRLINTFRVPFHTKRRLPGTYSGNADS